MKQWFAAALLLIAFGYTAYSLSTLTLLTSSGRPGAGFFPLLIGVLLVIACAIDLRRDLRASAKARLSGLQSVHQADPETEAKADTFGVDAHGIDGGPIYPQDVLIVFLYICVFVAIMPFAGSLVAMILFMLAFLFTFNSKHIVSNVLYSIALPALLYGLFRMLLNASLPIGPLGI